MRCNAPEKLRGNLASYDEQLLNDFLNLAS